MTAREPLILLAGAGDAPSVRAALHRVQRLAIDVIILDSDSDVAPSLERMAVRAREVLADLDVLKVRRLPAAAKAEPWRRQGKRRARRGGGR